MGNVYEGVTEEGHEWQIKIVKDRTKYQVLVFESTRISTFSEPNWYYAERRVMRIIALRKWKPKFVHY